MGGIVSGDEQPPRRPRTIAKDSRFNFCRKRLDFLAGDEDLLEAVLHPADAICG